MTTPPGSPVPGWYPDPSDPSKNIYWDGTRWLVAAPSASGAPPTLGTQSDKSRQLAVGIGSVVLVLVGLFMSGQSASLISGTGSIWTGVALTGIGTAIAFFMGARKTVRVMACVVLAVAFFNAVHMEMQMSERRAELSNIFDS